MKDEYKECRREFRGGLNLCSVCGSWCTRGACSSRSLSRLGSAMAFHCSFAIAECSSAYALVSALLSAVSRCTRNWQEGREDRSGGRGRNTGRLFTTDIVPNLLLTQHLIYYYCRQRNERCADLIGDVSVEAVLAESSVAAAVFAGNHRRRSLDFDVLAEMAVLVVRTPVLALQRARNAATSYPCHLQLVQLHSTSAFHTKGGLGRLFCELFWVCWRS